MSYKKITFILVFFCFSLFGCPRNVFSSTSASGVSRGKLPYKVEISGVIEKELREIFNQVSDLVRFKDRPPATRGLLEKRIREDRKNLFKAMRSFGYYAGRIDHQVDYSQDPVKITLKVETGPPFIIDEVRLKKLREDPPFDLQLPSPESLDLTPGERIKAVRVVEAKNKIKNELKAQGYPFPNVKLYEVLIDHNTFKAIIEFHLEPGPKAVFGEVEITGLERVKSEYVEQHIPWREGDRFANPLLAELRRELTAEGLFTLIEIKHGDQLDNENKLPIKINLRERDPRSFRVGAGYETDTGPQFRVSWLHRNLFGHGEKLNLEFFISEVKASLESGYTIPGFMDPANVLKLNSGVLYEDTDAYQSTSFYVKSILDRRITSEITLGGGVGYRLVRLDSDSERQNLGLLFFPLEASWDSRDDVLDPSRGFRVNLKLIPFIDTFDPETFFLKTHTAVSNYFQLMADKRVILATRAAVGTIGAERIEKVPVDERFFSGGGGSIRGYDYQSVGPREEGVPVGGLSQLELGAELRFRLSQRSGMVAFLDGGQVFEESYPDFSERLFWGYELGYRFYTDFGPIRIDLALPLNRRADIDDRFYIYLSIGQAF